MLIDTHAHLNFKAFDIDRNEVIERCQKMKVINVGAQYKTSCFAVELADSHNNFFASVGLHPIHVFDEEFNISDYQSLITDKVVAIGETGFDYFHPTFSRKKNETKSVEEIIARQKEIFLEHIKLAADNDLALICHGRNPSTSSFGKLGTSLRAGSLNGLNKYFDGKDVYQDILEILKAKKVNKAVIHFFGGKLEIAKKIIEQGYYIGVDGPITFKKKVEDLQKIVKEIPLEKILIETDCPYLTPEPHRGERNEPKNVEYVAEKIAEIKNLTKKEVIKQTWQNAKDLFKM